MLLRLSNLLVIAALVFSLGLHWMVLQSVAWIGMIVTYSQNAPLKEALVKTFDGQHPCKLCKAVQEGKKSEKKQPPEKPMNKLDLFCPSPSAALKAPAAPPLFTSFTGATSALGAAPPTPPPRRSHA